LSNIGFANWVATDREQYIRIAQSLASDLARLAELRKTLRERMLASPLMDAPRFARHIETAYRTMWQQRLAAEWKSTPS
jgi:predicted O-linked N-acetylglucosamine transferase (SPINDLY family)